jgi:hypothetical protein
MLFRHVLVEEGHQILTEQIPVLAAGSVHDDHPQGVQWVRSDCMVRLLANYARE